MTASQARKRQIFKELKIKLDKNGGGHGPEIIVTESLEDLSGNYEDALALLVPGSSSPTSILNRLENTGYQLMMLIAYRGDPLVNNGDQILLASQARHYLLKPAEQLMAMLSDIDKESIGADRETDERQNN